MKLTSADTFFLIVKLRILSYGGQYSFITKCPECGKKIEVSLNLSDLIVEELPEDFEDSMVIELPRTGDTVHTRLLTNEDDNEVDKEVKRYLKKFKDAGDPEIILRLTKSITSIELQEPNSAGDYVLTNPIDIQKYVENLTDLDATAISSTLAQNYGIQATLDTVCKECREEIEVDLRFTPRFFRPKYDSSNR